MSNLTEINLSKALQIFIKHPDKEDSYVADLIKRTNVSDNEAFDLLVFMPVSFTRIMLPHIDWNDGYLIYDGREYQHNLLSNTIAYNIIFSFSLAAIQKLDGPTILKVAGRSAEFKAINQLLLKGEAIEDIQLSEIVLTKPS